ncbi:glycosyltransferase [Candidatus Saccharibacteria bacterium]|nr:glycosyltransferase [Candidatus Saccharibacteria bacterium]
MSSKPLVSIVSVTYNQEKYVKAALDSFLMQQVNFAFEIIIADDCSADKTPDIIREYAEKNPDIIKPILRKHNLGVAGNFLATLKEARGKYIALCEGDDFWTDASKLQKQVDFLESNPDYSICFHPVRVMFENNEHKESTWPNIKDYSKITIKELLKENFIPTNSVLYRRQKYDSLSVDVMPIDWYLHAYHAQFGKIGFINNTMSTYRRHDGGIWWNSHDDKDKLWRAQGSAHANMYVELLKLYDKDEEKKIIYEGLNGTLSSLVSVDKRFGDHLIQEALNKYPDAVEPFIIYQYEIIKDQQQRIEAGKQEEERLNQAIIGLRGEIFKLRDELHTLKNSRVIGKIIKFREKLGIQLPRVKHLPTTVPRRFKGSISRFLPELLKIVLRKIRSLLVRIKGKISYGIQKQEVKYITVANKPVDKQLPLVSVIIPYYNRGDTIDDTLASLDAQTFKNVEIIIIDDGSTDPVSSQKLKDLEQSGLEASFIHQENQGVAAARNTGVSRAKGRYVVCLDSDDMLDTTFIEKCTMMLETSPDVSLVTTQMEIFGVLAEPFNHASYDALELYSNNMVITAAEFTKKAWEACGGYKSKIGYEDWEYWLNLAEHKFWGKSLPEPLFRYRTSMQSRYIEDKDIHWNNVKVIHSLHAGYKKIIKKLRAEHQGITHLTDPDTAFTNMSQPGQFQASDADKNNVLITVPWMTFGGAETLIYNYCREVKDKFNLSFVTGLKSDNEWEYKFREITSNIYHLANLFEDERLYIEFISNYIKTRHINVLHVIHNGFTFEMLPVLKERHPELKIVVTLFNDRVEYFEQSVKFGQYIDVFTSDNEKVTAHYRQDLGDDPSTVVIPNGINCYDEFNPDLYDRTSERLKLGLADNDMGVFFVGRLSVEKNPNIFLDAAKQVLVDHERKHVKFFVIGDGPMRPEVEKQIKEIDSKQVVYLGYQSEVASYFSAADIFVLPSSIEGFPLSILEAMAMKVVVVASDVGAIAEVIEDGVAGFVVPPASVERIVGAIEMLCDNPKKREAIKLTSRKKVETKYSNRLLGANYQKLYNELSE